MIQWVVFFRNNPRTVKKHQKGHQIASNNLLCVFCFALCVSASLVYHIASTCVSLTRRKQGQSRFCSGHGKALWRGLDSDLLTQNYMITKKLTFNIHFQSTKKNIPQLGHGTKSSIKHWKRDKIWWFTCNWPKHRSVFISRRTILSISLKFTLTFKRFPWIWCVYDSTTWHRIQ